MIDLDGSRPPEQTLSGYIPAYTAICNPRCLGDEVGSMSSNRVILPFRRSVTYIRSLLSRATPLGPSQPKTEGILSSCRTICTHRGPSSARDVVNSLHDPGIVVVYNVYAPFTIHRDCVWPVKLVHSGAKCAEFRPPCSGHIIDADNSVVPHVRNIEIAVGGGIDISRLVELALRRCRRNRECHTTRIPTCCPCAQSG